MAGVEHRGGALGVDDHVKTYFSGHFAGTDISPGFVVEKIAMWLTRQQVAAMRTRCSAARAFGADDAAPPHSLVTQDPCRVPAHVQESPGSDDR